MLNFSLMAIYCIKYDICILHHRLKLAQDGKMLFFVKSGIPWRFPSVQEAKFCKNCLHFYMISHNLYTKWLHHCLPIYMAELIGIRCIN